ncbi:MAG: class I SAM-dependent methyltransferase [Pseudolabrys sp.]
MPVKPLNWKKNDIEVDVSPNTLAALIRHVEANWYLLGEREPYWSVLTNEKYKAQTIGSNIEEFYSSGKGDVAKFTHAADRAGVDYRNLQRCFELGCGVGRMTIWLARIFPELVAVDISKSHLRVAAEALQREGLANVDLRLLNTIDKIETLPEFDCFVSLIVLQHNPPPVMAFLLGTILGKLKPGGLAYFQVPTYRVNAVFHADQHLANEKIGGYMEMHVLPQAVIWRIADEADCQLLDIREDGSTGISDGVSNSILLMKRVS